MTAARASKKSNNVVQKAPLPWCVKDCGDYAQVIVNGAEDTKRWFKISALEQY